MLVAYLFQIFVECPIVQPTQRLLEGVEVRQCPPLMKFFPLLVLPTLDILDEVDVESWRVDYDGLVEGRGIQHWQNVATLILQACLLLRHLLQNY